LRFLPFYGTNRQGERGEKARKEYLFFMDVFRRVEKRNEVNRLEKMESPNAEILAVSTLQLQICAVQKEGRNIKPRRSGQE